MQEQLELVGMECLVQGHLVGLNDCSLHSTRALRYTMQDLLVAVSKRIVQSWSIHLGLTKETERERERQSNDGQAS